MPNVILTFSNGGVQGPPGPAPKLTVNDQTITFELHPSAANFAAQPIVFATPPPAGYHAWPGSAPTVNGNTVTAHCNRPLGLGQKQKYKYNIVWNGGELDPEIENVGSGPFPDDRHDHGKPGR
jgi:hypothetical protein